MCQLLKIACTQYLQSLNSHSLLNSTVAPTPALKLSSDVTSDLLVAKPSGFFPILVYLYQKNWALLTTPCLSKLSPQGSGTAPSWLSFLLGCPSSTIPLGISFELF